MYHRLVKAEDIRGLARRRWDLVERLEAEHWVAEKRRMSPLDALRLADGLRAHASRLRPCWPSERERAEDLALHDLVARKLARARPLAGR